MLRDLNTQTLQTRMREKFIAFAKQTELIRFGYTGMVQFHFAKIQFAESFITWCKTKDALKDLGIVKAHIQTKNHAYIVRLAPRQCKMLYGDGYDFAKLKNLAQQTETLAHDDENLQVEPEIRNYADGEIIQPKEQYLNEQLNQ